MTHAAAPASTEPLLRVVRGRPTPEEVAALVAVLVALVAASRSAGARDDVRPTSRWASRVDAVRTPVPAGPHAWRTSAWRP